MIHTNKLQKYDSKLWNMVDKENQRQEENIELIASENYASALVLELQGSQLTNKYAEGYPKKRYYAGCEYVDEIELLAIDRAKELFQADYANVQPHSGSQANNAVYSALLNPYDIILGMDLNHGGHLTHGSKVNFSGKIYQSISYGINNKGKIDYIQIEKLANKYKPKMIIGGFSAYSGLCDWKLLREISDSIGSYLLVDMSHIAGLVASKLYSNPLPYAHVVTSTTHKTLAGPRGGLILSNEKNEELYKKINSSIFPGTQGGPLMHVIAAKAVSFKEAMSSKFKNYQKQVIRNAQIMVEIFLKNNFKIVSGGTKNHLFLIDLTDRNITGKKAEEVLHKANITVNKNSIPNDSRSPFVTSGIRIGTPAITRRGFQDKETSILSLWIIEILNNIDCNTTIQEIKNKVLDMCFKHPVYRI
ncbi:serine hydroxymethyltransferase [Buchnera aphidicola]|uniref:serine hydroxymethyltransferase n=1 Tax=Buchnera aphidicola TaxID=9 RepID=UPI003D18AE68